MSTNPAQEITTQFQLTTHRFDWKELNSGSMEISIKFSSIHLVRSALGLAQWDAFIA
jgi:hypothetical protein